MPTLSAAVDRTRTTIALDGESGARLTGGTEAEGGAMSAARRGVTGLVVVVGVLLLLGACAAGVNTEQSAGGANFWAGLWHGVILPVTFVVSLFTDTVSIYEVDNNGNWYDFGFVLGIAMFSGPVIAGGRRH